jgi:hypothetical protein
LYDEEQQRNERRQKGGTSSSGFPNINITNVLPESLSPSFPTAAPLTYPVMKTPSLARSKRLHIPGPRDASVQRYCTWQQAKVTDLEFKKEYQKACTITLAEGLDLEQVYIDQDPDFYIGQGIRRGIARRLVSDIDIWVKLCESDQADEFVL